MRSVHVKCQFPQVHFCCCFVLFVFCFFVRACVRKMEEAVGYDIVIVVHNARRINCYPEMHNVVVVHNADRIMDPTTTSLKCTTLLLCTMLIASWTLQLRP